jgi:hypothetical protein
VSQFIIEETVKRLSDLVDIFNKKTESQECIWEAIWCDNPFLYKVEVDLSIHKESKVRKWDLISLQEQNWECMAWIVVNEKQLLSKKRLSICFLQSADGSPIRIKQQEISWRKRSSIFFRKNLIYSLDLANLEIEDREKIENSLFYKNKDKFIWYVSYWSNIHQIRIELLIENSQDSYSRIKEWSIVTVDIHNRKALYQIIDWITFEEILDKHDKHWYLTGIAQKLWEYNPIKKSINTVKWVPSIYSPVFFDTTEWIEIDLTKSIWILPETSLDIEIKDFDDLVTHNTAILWILWIGKSCLTFELIQKVINNTDCKVICIDITSEYIRALSKYFNGDFLFSVDESKFSKLKDKNSDWNVDDPTSWGNEEYYKVAFLDWIINDFSQSNKRILILNPDRHNVSKAGSLFKIQHKIDLTIAEKVRIISERVFIHAKDKRNVSEIGKAKYLIVFEEAHSLIPEWNSTANEWDKSAVNWTSKVILQWRKYWLWSFVVTQRTANISKSILNQCNTIFWLRIFDDTWKQFLENYIWSNYANTLPSLEERHAIVIWKALKLKQPIIIKLNNKDDIILSTL